MPVLEADDSAPRRSSIIRSEIRGYQRDMTEAAERGDKIDYAQAVANIDAAKRELSFAEAHERRRAQEAEDRARFKQETGYDSVGDLIATEVQNGTWAAKQRIAAAERSQRIAEAMLKPKPTNEDLAAEALAKITEQTKAVKKDARTEIQQILDDIEIGDEAA